MPGASIPGILGAQNGCCPRPWGGPVGGICGATWGINPGKRPLEYLPGEGNTPYIQGENLNPKGLGNFVRKINHRILHHSCLGRQNVQLRVLCH